jgi:hypothetical protein
MKKNQKHFNSTVDKTQDKISDQNAGGGNADGGTDDSGFGEANHSDDAHGRGFPVQIGASAGAKHVETTEVPVVREDP